MITQNQPLSFIPFNSLGFTIAVNGEMNLNNLHEPILPDTPDNSRLQSINQNPVLMLFTVFYDNKSVKFGYFMPFYYLCQT